MYGKCYKRINVFMKTLMIIVPSLEGGGQEKVSTITGKVLGDMYKIVFVIFTDKNAKYETTNVWKFINLGIPAYNDIIRKIVSVFLKTLKIRKLKKQYRVSATISFGRPANVVNCLSKYRDKIICSIRNSSFLETQKHNYINKLIYLTSDSIVFLSEGQRLLTVRAFPEIKGKNCVIYNPCDMDLVSKRSDEETDMPWKEGRILVSCGRLESVKCFINLCNAFSLAKQRCSDIKLLIMGEGSLKDHIENHIKELGLEEDIKLIGFVDNPYKYLSKCTLFVFSTSREGFANVIIDALACGLPVISTDHHFGAREILAGNFAYITNDSYTLEEYGILTPCFEEGNDNQLKKEKIFADAIIRILSDDKLLSLYRNKARSRSMDFGLKEYEDKWISELTKQLEQ